MYIKINRIVLRANAAVETNSNAASMSLVYHLIYFFFSSRRRHTRLQGDWSSDVCSSDLIPIDVHDRLHVQADARHMSLSLLASVLLAEGLDRIGNDPVVIPNRDANASEIGRASCRERV